LGLSDQRVATPNVEPWEFIVVGNSTVRYRIGDYHPKQMMQMREMSTAVRGLAKMTGDGFRHAPDMLSLSLASQQPKRVRI
jgi:hypothetical protein